jgi:hypothetical protein
MPLRSTHRVAIAAPGAGAPGMLNIVYVEQEQLNWCWAACCEMVFDLTGVTINGNPVKQCEMATAQFHGACCSAPSSSICDQGCWPENAYNYYEFNF